MTHIWGNSHHRVLLSTLAGLWPTDNACKHFGDKSKTIYWNNIAGPNWKAYYDKVKGYCDGAGSGNTNPQWRHPFPCKPYLHEYYGGALDSKLRVRDLPRRAPSVRLRVLDGNLGHVVGDLGHVTDPAPEERGEARPVLV